MYKIYLRLDAPGYYLLKMVLQVQAGRTVGFWTLVGRDSSLEDTAQAMLQLGREIGEYYTWSSGQCDCARSKSPLECAPGTIREAYKQLERKIAPEVQDELRGISRPEDLDPLLWWGPGRAIKDMWIASGLLGRRMKLAGIPSDDEASMLLLFGFARHLEGEFLDEHDLAAYHEPRRRRPPRRKGSRPRLVHERPG